jgi:exosortase/archaeosortase family protein
MRRPVLHFALIFFGCLLGFSVFAVATNLQNHLKIVEDSIAGAATWMAQLSGSSAKVVEGNFIAVSGMSLNINHECTGVFVLFVLVSFIAAYPAGFALKLLGMTVGVTVLSFINVLRIATLVRLVEAYPSLFVYFHEYVWQGAFLMLVTLYAITWVEWVRR